MTPHLQGKLPGEERMLPAWASVSAALARGLQLLAIRDLATAVG